MTARIGTLSHTADVGFRVEASSLEELFKGAARGLTAVLLGAEAGGEAGESTSAVNGEPERWSLSRPDMERLLVAWLRELLHRAQSEGRLPARTAVHLTEGPSLEAEVWWDPTERREDLVREIKGVTYHGLAVEERDDGWRARVVLDV